MSSNDRLCHFAGSIPAEVANDRKVVLKKASSQVVFG